MEVLEMKRCFDSLGAGLELFRPHWVKGSTHNLFQGLLCCRPTTILPGELENGTWRGGRRGGRVPKKDWIECPMQSELGIKLAYYSIRDVESRRWGREQRRGAHRGSTAQRSIQQKRE